MYINIKLDQEFKFCDSNGIEVEAIPIADIVQRYIPRKVTYTTTLLNPYTVAGDGTPILTYDNNRDYVLEIVFTREGNVEENYEFGNFSYYNGDFAKIKNIIRISQDVYHIIFNVFPYRFINKTNNVASTLQFSITHPLTTVGCELSYYYYTDNSELTFTINGPSILAAGGTGSYELVTNLSQNDLTSDNIRWFVLGDATLSAGADPYHINITANASGSINPLVFCVIISSCFTHDSGMYHFISKYAISVSGRSNHSFINYELLEMYDNYTVNRVQNTTYNSLIYLSGRQLMFGSDFTYIYSLFANQVLYDKNNNIITSYYDSSIAIGVYNKYNYIWYSDPSIDLPEGIYRLNYKWNYSTYDMTMFDLQKEGKRYYTVCEDNYEYYTFNNGILEYYGENLYNYRAGNDKFFIIDSNKTMTLRIYANKSYSRSFIEIYGGSYKNLVDVEINGIRYKIPKVSTPTTLRSHYISLNVGWNDITIKNLNTESQCFHILFWWASYNGESHRTNSVDITGYDVYYPNNVIQCESAYWYTNNTYKVICCNQYPDVTYNWKATSNCTIVSGQGTAEITVTPTLAGTAIAIDCDVTYNGNIISLGQFTVGAGYVFNG